MTKRIAPFLLAAMLCLSAWSTQAQAATITVTTTADSGAGSLRAAVGSANTNLGPDEIVFSSLFNSAQEISLDTALPAFTGTVTVTGPGAKLLTIKDKVARSNFLFTTEPGVSATFSGLTISNGTLAIYNQGNGLLTVTDCVFTGALQAIYNTGTNANSSITRCTFSGNTAGFVYQFGAGTGTLTNCTFSNNSNGITVSAGTAQFLTLINCTISGNTSGINHTQQPDPVTPVVIKNTIVADNTRNFEGANATDGGNNFTGTQAMLGPLQDNGGPTETMALLEGSPAINEGNDAIAPATDQRGVLRPQRRQSDIGAFELEPPQSLIVTTNVDENDGTSAADSGAGTSLREAIIFANSNANTSTITFDIAGEGPFAINLTSALPVLSTSINIHNETGKAITVKRSSADGTPDFRIFKISNGTSTGPTVDITNLTISNGNGGTDEFGVGGGIFNENGTLSLTNCIISGNSVPDFSVGGGIFTNAFEGPASLTVTDCTFTGNSASGENGRGGAIASIVVNGGAGTVTVTGSTFSGNTAASNGGGILNLVANGGTGTLDVTDSTLSGNTAGGDGGGIYNSKGELTLTSSTLSGNSANNGGGVYNDAEGADADIDVAMTTVTNSTFSGNTATEYGGGIYNNGQNGSATLDITNATFSGNSATTGGGGLFNNATSGSATLDINNSILKKGANGANIAGIGTINSNGFNLSDDAAGGDAGTAPGGFLDGIGDKRNTDPQLGDLQDNGGPTFTHLPTDDSPAVSRGKTTLEFDQRGVERPQGARDDIGAVEIVGAAAPVNSAPVVSDISITPDEDTTFTFAASNFEAGFADSDDDSLQTIKIVSLPSNGVLKLNDVAVTAGQEIAADDIDLLTYKANLNYHSTDSFDWNGSDGTEYSAADANVNITVTEVNDDPTLDPIPTINSEKGTLINFFAVGKDVDTDTVLEYSLISAPTGATINSATGEFRWTPTSAQGPATYNFQIKVEDGEGGEAVQDVTINVTNANIAPVLPLVGERTIYFGGTTTYNFAATDADLPKNTLTYSLIGAPAGASINPTTGVFSWTPTASQANPANNFYSFKVRVVDNGSPSKSDEETAFFTVQYPAEILVSTTNPSLKADGKSQSVTFTYTVRNNTNSARSNLRVQGGVFWPSTLQSVTLTSSTGTTATQSTLTASSKRIIWNIPSLPAYSSKTLTVKLTGVVPTNAPQKSRIASGFVLSPVSGSTIPNNTSPEVFLNTYK